MRKYLFHTKSGLRPTIFLSLTLMILVGLMGISVVSAQEPTPPKPGDSAPTLLAALAQNGAQITYHADGRQAHFIGMSPGRSIKQPTALRQGASGEEAARGFLSVYGSLFGINDQSRELTHETEKKPDAKRTFERFQQLYNGIPVLAGELIVQVDSSNNILSANGETLPNISVSTTPTISANTAANTALINVSRIYNIPVSNLTVSTPVLWIYNPQLVTPDAGPTQLVWRMEVKPKTVAPINQFILINAQRGNIALQFNQVDTVLNRKTYTANDDVNVVLPGTVLLCTEAQQNCGETHAQGAHENAKRTYDFYMNNFGRDSIDGAGMTIISTVHYNDPTQPFPLANAFWDGTQMVYGDAEPYPLAYDVVGHELTHGVTQYESGLLYVYQSGAINESLSDVFGEMVELSNGISDPNWLLGEQIGVPLRSMSNPPAFGDPDRITSPNYFVGDYTHDNGGVHTNSGVNNKAAYLITEGGTFNGHTVVGLGLTKAAHIYYEVQTNLLASGSNYNDLYDALYQGCFNLVGTFGITTNDCRQVRSATDAVAMNGQPPGNPNYAPYAPLCPAGSVVENTAFSDNFENGTSNWTFDYSGPSNGWNQNLVSPYSSLDIAHSGTHYLYADDDPPGVSDDTAAMSNAVHIPPNAYLHFADWYAFDHDGAIYYDGGVVEYSIDGGVNWIDAGTLFDADGYNGVLTTGWGNHLSGHRAFVGETRLLTYTSSRANLASLAGKDVKFRWRLVTDQYFSYFGWFVDDVQIYTCISLNAAPPRNYFTTDKPTLTWNRVTFATTYTVQVSKSNTFAGSPAFSTTVNAPQLSVQTTHLDNGTYYWRVSANGGSTWSIPDSFVVNKP